MKRKVKRTETRKVKRQMKRTTGEKNEENNKEHTEAARIIAFNESGCHEVFGVEFAIIIYEVIVIQPLFHAQKSQDGVSSQANSLKWATDKKLSGISSVVWGLSGADH